MLSPNTIAAHAASALPLEVPPGPVRSPVVGQATRTAPVTTVASAASAIQGRRSPASTAIAAATPPSVEMIGATTPTFPDLTAVYSSSRPATLPSPAIASHPACAAVGTGRCAAATPAERAKPTMATQARTGAGPISRLARVAQSVETANDNAAASPPAMAIISYCPFAPCIVHEKLLAAPAAAGNGDITAGRVH